MRQSEMNQITIGYPDMKEIGGYFELELPMNANQPLHPNGVKVNSGRHALEYILRVLGNKVKRLWVPYYTCEVVLQPIHRLGLEYEFYQVNMDLEIDSKPDLTDGDYIIVNNYFGIKDAYINELACQYKGKLIVDNAQAWYNCEMPGFNTFYSPRKFFGMPDGGLAWATGELNNELERDHSYDRCSHLLKRIDSGASEGYAEFNVNSKKIGAQPLKRMSSLSDRILSSIDFDWVRIKRRSNFEMLHEVLKGSNGFNIPPMQSFASPMVYPYLTNDASLRQRLIDNKIFVATYWPNVLEWCHEDSTEYKLAKNLLPLPIDQRYGEDDMERIITQIL